MWPRQTEPVPDRESERSAEEDLKGIIGEVKETDGSGPDDSYWSGLLVRTNRRIDVVSSGKAISLSWAARVAIPGAIAIIFFFIGLHYYEPDPEPRQMSVREYISTFPEETRDSIAGYFLKDMSVEDFGFVEDFLVAADDEAVEYLINRDGTDEVIEMLSDSEIEELMTLLNSGNRL